MISRRVKKIYTDIIIESLINDKWSKSSYYSYQSPRKKIDSYSYIFIHEIPDFHIFQTIVIHINEKQKQVLRYSMFSKTYWMIVRMKRDIKFNYKNAELEVFVGLHKAYKEHGAKKSIEELNSSIERLSEMEAECKKRLEELESKGQGFTNRVPLPPIPKK